MSTGSLCVGFSLNTSLTLSTCHWEICKIMPLISITITAWDSSIHLPSYFSTTYLIFSSPVQSCKSSLSEKSLTKIFYAFLLSHIHIIFSADHITNLTILNGMYDVLSDILSSSTHSNSNPPPSKLYLHFFSKSNRPHFRP